MTKIYSIKFEGKLIPKPNWDFPRSTPKTSAGGLTIGTLTDSSNERKIDEIERNNVYRTLKMMFIYKMEKILF